jgi:hypothetical protein
MYRSWCIHGRTRELSHSASYIVSSPYSLPLFITLTSNLYRELWSFAFVYCLEGLVLSNSFLLLFERFNFLIFISMGTRLLT